MKQYQRSKRLVGELEQVKEMIFLYEQLPQGAYFVFIRPLPA